MNKKVGSFVLALVMIVSLFPVSVFATEIVADGVCGKNGANLTWALDSTGTLTISGSGAMADYADSPQNVGDTPWKEHSSKIRRVVVQSGVTNIGWAAFTYCENLAQVDMADTVTSIGGGAFGFCPSLKTIDLPESITTIDICAFAQSGLTRIKIPSRVETIAEGAFGNCFSLVNVLLPNSVTSIEASSFYSCNSLTEITLPFRVESIGNYAFKNCESLRNITIPDSITSIGYSAFLMCNALEDVYYTGTQERWGAIQFEHGNENLCDAKIHYGAAPSHTEFVDFGSCGMQGNNLTWTLDDSGILTISGNGAMADYDDNSSGKSAPWQDVSTKINTVVVENGVTSIGDYAFYGCSDLGSVTISSGVVSIGSYAFSCCHSLNSITIPGGLSSIGSYAFSYCSNLNSITIPIGTTAIGDYAFYKCRNLSNATLPDSVTSLGAYAFYECESLSDVKIPAKVTAISEYTFYGCSSLSNVTIQDGTTNIGEYAFYGCSSLINIILPETVTLIGNYAFWECQSLASVKLPATLQILGEGAFSGCTSLISVSIPSSLTEISKRAFLGCTKLASVEIPNSIKTIAYAAFDNCGALTDVYFGGSDMDWQMLQRGIDGGNIALSNATKHYAWIVPKDHGKLGDDISWTLENGTLTFSGKGLLTLDGTLCAWDSDAVKSVVIGDGITGIDTGMFAAHLWMETVSIPDSVTSIGDRAFGDCQSLKHVSLPERLTAIGEYAFLNCISLDSIVLPNSIVSIGAHAFGYVERADYIFIPASVTHIGERAFEGCGTIFVDPDNPAYCSQDGALFNKDMTVLMKGSGTYYDSENYLEGASFRIPRSVKSIDHFAFCGGLSQNFTSVMIPRNVTNIGNGIFGEYGKPKDVYYEGSESEWNTIDFSTEYSGCDSWKTTVTIHYNSDFSCYDVIDSGTCGNALRWSLAGDGILRITGNGAMTEFGFIPERGEYIEAPWKQYDEKIRGVHIECGVTSVGALAFQYCRNITEVYIPSTVTAIGESAFEASSGRESYGRQGNFFLGRNVSSLGSAALSRWAGRIIVPEENAWFCEENGALFTIGKKTLLKMPSTYAEEYVIPEGVETLASGAFVSRYDLQNIVLPESLKTIEDGAFQDCDNLTVIHIPAGVTSIGAMAFNGARISPAIDVATDNQTYTSQDGVLFSKDMTTLHIGSGVTKSNYAIPDGVTTIGESAFFRSNTLQTLTMPDSVKTIGWNAFWGSDLETVSLSPNLTTLDGCAFEWCSELKEITIPGSLSEIGQLAFEGCSSLERVIIQDGVRLIAWGAFSDCKALTTISLPASITEIYPGAFEGCTLLTDIWYAGERAQWDAITVSSRNDSLRTANIHCGKSIGAATVSTPDAAVRIVAKNGTSLGVKVVDGVYSIVDKPAGTYTIVVEKPGFVTYEKQFTYTGNNCPPDVTLVRIGNINGSTSAAGEVDAADMQCLYEMLSTDTYTGKIEDEEYRKAVADVNGDGDLNILDYQRLYMALSGKSPF